MIEADSWNDRIAVVQYASVSHELKYKCGKA